MMYKTVNFNIFEENLEEIVYRKESALPEKEEKSTVKKTEIKTEIVIKPINHYCFNYEREGTSLVL